MTKIYILIIVSLLSISSAFAISFPNSEIKEDLTSFEWCFDSPFDSNRNVQSEDFLLYVDHVSGCENVDYELYYEEERTFTYDKCRQETVCADEWFDGLNGTYEAPVCNSTLVCETFNYDKTIHIPVYDKNLKTTDRLCLKADRDANTKLQSCDMNFIFDDGFETFNTRDYGFAWWNLSYGVKYLINVSSSSQEPDRPFRLIINSSYITMEDCQSDGGDVRFVNSTENGELVYNLSSWNTTTGIVYINESLASDLSFYLYCNASSTLSTTSVALDLITNDLFSVHKLDEASGNAIDTLGWHDVTEVGTVSSQTGIDDSARGAYTGSDSFRSTSPAINTADDLSTSVWVRYNGGLSTNNYDIWDLNDGGSPGFEFTYENGGSQNRFLCWINKGAGGQGGAAKSTSLSVGSWYHFACVWNQTHITAYVNGSAGTPVSVGAGTDGSSGVFSIGSTSSGGNPASIFYIDELYHWNRSLTQDEITDLSNPSFYGFYDLPTYSFGTRQTNFTPSTIETTIRDESFNDLNLSPDEQQIFFIYANWSYTENGTSIDDGVCNYTLNGIADVYMNETIDTNTSICSGGCDTANYTWEYKNLESIGYIEDEFVFKLCRFGAVKDFVISSSCGDDEVIPGGNVIQCSLGFTNYSFVSSTCNAATEVNLSIWSTATSPSNALISVDTYSDIRRVHNHTEPMIYNASILEWQNPPNDRHSIINATSINLTVNCSNAYTSATNTSLLTAGNLAPIILLGELWDYFNGFQQFLPPTIVSGRYPLQNSMNASGSCLDPERDTLVVNLTYDNGTLIYSQTFTGGIFPSSVNWTIGNFSTQDDFLDGVRNYNFTFFCNDSLGSSTTSVGSFYAIDNRPAFSWNDSSPFIFNTVPYELFLNCIDPESGVTGYNKSYVFVNGTLNISGSLSNYNYNWNDSLQRNLTGICEDELRNSTSKDLLAAFVEMCAFSVSGITHGGRYQDNILEIVLLCTNSLPIDSCQYYLNDFTVITPDNCSLFNVTLMRGKSDINFTVVSGGENYSERFHVWALDSDADFWSYSVIIFLIIMCGLLFFMAEKSGYGFIHILNIFTFLILGFNMLIFDWWIGTFVIIAGILISGLLALRGKSDGS